MTLSHMISIDEDALMCDLAEVYHIYDYKSLPVSLVATFSCGLRDESRIKMKISDAKVSLNTVLLASILDKVNWIAWSKTEDGHRNANHPKSILSIILGQSDGDKDVLVFNDSDDYESVRNSFRKDG